MKPPEESASSNTSIGKLPADVICLILTFLPMKQAVRTSILSTQWRHHWRRIPQLVFGEDFASIRSRKVMLEIYQALLGHEGPVNKFELAVPRMSRCPQVGQLIHYLSTKNVKELSLVIPDAVNDSEELLPSSLLLLPDLITLKLQGFKFVQPPWSVGFSKLTILQLENLILPAGFYEGFLPLCPLLQELRVVDRNVNNLELVFAAPCLKLLFLQSYLCSVCFENTPRLSVLSILDVGKYNYTSCEGFFKQYNPDMVALFAALPALEELNVGFELLLFLSDGYVPYLLPESLHNLKVLEASHLLLGRLPEVEVLLCLIRSSPNLRKLTIVHDDDLCHPASMPIDSLQMLLEPSHHFGVYCLQQLEEFNIENTRGTRVELDLLKFVLTTAPELKRVSIKPKEDLSSDTMLKFIVEVTQYKRISKEAEVNYVLTNED